MKELRTLVDETVRLPAIDAAAFPNTPWGGLWTSSPWPGVPFPHAWVVDFNDGSAGYTGLDGTYQARCVH